MTSVIMGKGRLCFMFISNHQIEMAPGEQSPPSGLTIYYTMEAGSNASTAEGQSSFPHSASIHGVPLLSQYGQELLL